MWSLNHVGEPQLVFEEASRVLQPRARWRVVLDDIEPTWFAVGAAVLKLVSVQVLLIPLEESGREMIKRKLINLLRHQQWPLQSDHLRICEQDNMRWCRLLPQGQAPMDKRFPGYELVTLPKRADDDG